MRLLHAGRILSVAAAALGRVAFFGLHRPAGYEALTLIAVRTVLGFRGSGAARFASFVRGPRATLRYAMAVRAGCGTAASATGTTRA